MNPLHALAIPTRKLRALAADQVRATLDAAMPQPFPGILTLVCACTEEAQIDRELTGADLVAVTQWLDAHNRHGARIMTLQIPAGTITKVGIQL